MKMKPAEIRSALVELRLLARSASEMHEPKQFDRQCRELCDGLSKLREHLWKAEHFTKADSEVLDLFMRWLAQSPKIAAREIAKDLRWKQLQLLDTVRSTIYILGQFGQNGLNAYLYEEAAKLSVIALAAAFKEGEEKPRLRVILNTGSAMHPLARISRRITLNEKLRQFRRS